MEHLKNYKLAVALLRFRTAYKELVDASTNLPDTDLGENYPFYLLDFESIVPAVTQWCTLHASRLLQGVPNKVDNPACVKCLFFKSGIAADGSCVGQQEVGCGNYPTVIFTRELAIAFLGISDIKSTSDDSLFAQYVNKMEVLYEQNRALRAKKTAD